MRLDRAQRRLDRRYPDNPSRTTAEEHGTQDKVSKGQALPNRLQEDSQDDELKCPTSDEEDKSMMEDYEAPSVAPDEDMASPEDTVMIVESEILQLIVQLGGSKQRYIDKFTPYAREAAKVRGIVRNDGTLSQAEVHQPTITEVYSPPRVTEWSKRLPQWHPLGF